MMIAYTYARDLSIYGTKRHPEEPHYSVINNQLLTPHSSGTITPQIKIHPHES